MWANSVWGFFALSAACVLTMIGLPSESQYQPRLLVGALACAVFGFITFLWPLRKAEVRQNVRSFISSPRRWLGSALRLLMQVRITMAPNTKSNLVSHENVSDASRHDVVGRNDVTDQFSFKKNEWPNVFRVDLAQNDIDLLLFPDMGKETNQDAVKLIAFGASVLLGKDELTSDFLSGKLLKAWESAPNVSPGKRAFLNSFFDVYAPTVVQQCIDAGYFERVALLQGGRLRLYKFHKDDIERIANSLNYRA